MSYVIIGMIFSILHVLFLISLSPGRERYREARRKQANDISQRYKAEIIRINDLDISYEEKRELQNKAIEKFNAEVEEHCKHVNPYGWKSKY